MKRDQSIAFLRSLRAGNEGATIYQDVIDDVLAALDDCEREREALVRRAEGAEAALSLQTERVIRMKHIVELAQAFASAAGQSLAKVFDATAASKEKP